MWARAWLGKATGENVVDLTFANRAILKTRAGVTALRLPATFETVLSPRRSDFASGAHAPHMERSEILEGGPDVRLLLDREIEAVSYVVRHDALPYWPVKAATADATAGLA